MVDGDPLEDIERVFGLLSQQFGTELAGVPTDVVDAGDAFVVLADLPGFDREAIDVTLSEGRTVEIAATRERDDDVDGRYVRRERRRRAADRTVTLPAAVEPDGAAATYEDGVLRVRFPKASSDDEGETIPVE